MADQQVKIMDLGIATPVSTDWIPFVDISDTTQSAQGSTKRALKSDLQGANGTNGTNGTDGIDITWLGAYNAGTGYVVNDAVSYSGSSYICKLASIGNLPTNITYWDLMAQKGTDGAGAGDMLASTYDPANIAQQVAGLTATQTFSTGLKTFLNGMFALRNVANTFSGFFTNTNTTDRTYTLKDANGTLAFTTDITGTNSGTNTGDQTSIVGITGTMAQFDTAVTDGNIVYQSQALGTPASGTLTNCTGLPVAGITASTSTSLGVGSIELGNASDTTISRVSAGQAGIEGIRVLTTTPVVLSAASYTTDTGTSLNMDNLDMFIVTAQAGALLFNSPGGTLVQGRKLIIRIKDNGTARALTWNAVFRAMGTALPSTTVLSKTLYLGFIYSSTDTKWDLIASAQEA